MIKFFVFLISFISLTASLQSGAHSDACEEYFAYRFYDTVYKELRPNFNTDNYELISAIKYHIENKLIVKVPFRRENVCDKVVNGLYIGGRGAIKYCMKTHKVDRIVSLISTSKRMVPKSFKGKVLTINIKDSRHSNIVKPFDRVYKFMNGSKKGVLVHCMKGRSRSAAMCILYMMVRYDVSYETAYHYLKTKRPSIGLNSSFIKQLKNVDLCKNAVKVN